MLSYLHVVYTCIRVNINITTKHGQVEIINTFWNLSGKKPQTSNVFNHNYSPAGPPKNNDFKLSTEDWHVSSQNFHETTTFIFDQN